MRVRKTRYCPALSGSDGPKDWEQNGKGRWKCLRCHRTGLIIRTRHRSWPPPVLIPAYGDRRGSRNEILAYLQVSPIDAPLVRYKYRLTTNGYGYRQTWRTVKGKRKRCNLFIQREILGLEPGDPIQGHHIDDNPLNNQRWNLEKTTASENNQYKFHRNIRTRVLPIREEPVDETQAAGERHIRGIILGIIQKLATEHPAGLAVQSEIVSAAAEHAIGPERTEQALSTLLLQNQVYPKAGRGTFALL